MSKGIGGAYAYILLQAILDGIFDFCLLMGKDLIVALMISLFLYKNFELRASGLYSARNDETITST